MMRTSWWLAFCVSISLSLAPSLDALAATNSGSATKSQPKKKTAEKKNLSSKSSPKAKKSSAVTNKVPVAKTAKTAKPQKAAAKTAKSAKTAASKSKLVAKKNSKSVVRNAKAKTSQTQKVTKVKLRKKQPRKETQLPTYVVRAKRLPEDEPRITPRVAVAKPAAFLDKVFEPGHTSFHVYAKDLPFTYRIASLYLSPQQQLDFSIVDADKQASFKVLHRGGKLQRVAANDYRWNAPSQSGVYRLEIFKGSERMLLNLFVLKPMPKSGTINNYRIGHYPEAAKEGDPRYMPPTGLIEVTEDNKDMLISPHFRLGQFICKQDGGFPKYLYLQERLLLKLEWLLAEVNRRGYHSPSFSVMSGYRTPFYNSRLNNVSLSRHQWGDAADIFIDNDQDGVLDDLNRDGRIDKADAEVLYRLFEELEQPNPHMHGGLGIYEANAYHGPFVHIDARGTQARWGMRD